MKAYKNGAISGAKGFPIATLLNQTPDVPTSFLVVAASSSSIILTWINGVKPQDGISIERSLDGLTSWAEIDTETGDEYTDTTLTANHYFYRIRAYKGTKYSDYTTVASNSEPLIAFNADTVAWFDYTKMDTIIKDGGSKVSRWNDRLGSGHDLLQGTVTNQPLYSGDGISFDGIDNFMNSIFPLDQPTMLYMVFSKNNYVPYYNIIDGGSIINTGALIHGGTSPQTYIKSGGGDAAINSNMNISEFAVVRVLFNGASSKLIVNNTTPTTGNPGTASMGGITLSKSAQLSYFTANTFKEIIIRKVSDNATNEADIYNYLSLKHSFT